MTTARIDACEKAYAGSLWPDVWGPGQLLAFSGLDGPVDYRGQLVFQTAESMGAFRLRIPQDTAIHFDLPATYKPVCLLGDAVVLSDGASLFQFTFASDRLAIGSKPAGVALRVGGVVVGDSPVRLAARETQNASAPGSVPARVFAIATDTRWAIASLATDEPQAVARALAEALAMSVEEVLGRRMAWVDRVAGQHELSAHEARLLRKALSVMKVNIMSAQGNIRRLWSTPDRWPHRQMWLWDSAFHAVGWVHFDPAAAQEMLLAMLEQMREDGFLPLCISPVNPPSEVTQPPILAWAVERIYRITQDQAWLKTCLPYLQGYLAWNLAHRDQNHNGLFEWYIDHNPLCRSGESGMDNSPRFDEAITLDAVDFSAMMAREFEALANLAAVAGDESLARLSRESQQKITLAIEAKLWDGSAQFYVDRDFDGRFTGVLASSGFLPLLTDGPAEARVKALASHLNNPQTFGSALPVPSVSLNSGAFSKDMWRGPTWININFLIVEGLKRHGEHAIAGHVVARSLEAVEQAYLKTGCIYEYFDSLDVTHPADLDRKQRFAHRQGIAPISDYHWSSALTALMLIEKGQSQA